MPTVTFGTSAQFGSLTGWSEQNATSTVSSSRARVLGPTGNEVASNLYDERTDVDQPYTANTTAGVSPPATLGALVNSLMLTDIEINTTAGEFAGMSLRGHNHTANAHTGTERTIAHGIALTSGFGAYDFLSGTAGSNASLSASSIRITCQHRDEIAADGTHFVGENYDAMMEATVDWVGVPSSVGGSGWDIVSTETRTDNQGFLHTIVNATKKLTLA